MQRCEGGDAAQKIAGDKPTAGERGAGGPAPQFLAYAAYAFAKAGPPTALSFTRLSPAFTRLMIGY